jgi:alkylation response protein AidB-like acyl-CoA dehydrogenase
LVQVFEAGYAVPSWPGDRYGRGLSTAASRAVAAEFARVGAPGSGQDVSSLPAIVLLVHGSRAQQDRLLPPLLSGRVRWCLLYSEPGAGSDLAAAQTTATPDGAAWVVNGQKVWTSNAHHADRGLLLARTNWDVPKHRGLTFFWFPMDQPGVEVRPIRQITGDAHFNEVFIDEARVADADRLGDVGDGWRTLQTALAYERILMGSSQSVIAAIVGAGADAATALTDRPSAHLVDHVPSDLVTLARTRGLAHDPVARQRMAHVFTLRALNWLNGRRARAAGGGQSNPTASIAKLAMSRLLHDSAHVASELLGVESTLVGDEHPQADQANLDAMAAYVNSIGGGTDQVQRNIIGERVLGLPREPQVDRDVPFRAVRRSPSRWRRD